MFKQIRPAAALLPIALSVAAAFVAPTASAEVIKIALIETLSGAFAPIGQNQLNTYQMFAEMSNKQQLAGAGNTIEVVGFDGKGSPQESLTQL